jgi:hypothetical protein
LRAPPARSSPCRTAVTLVGSPRRDAGFVQALSGTGSAPVLPPRTIKVRDLRLSRTPYSRGSVGTDAVGNATQEEHIDPGDKRPRAAQAGRPTARDELYQAEAAAPVSAVR